MPYYVLRNNAVGTVFDASNDGAIAPDGNPEWLEYQEWLAEGNSPDERDV